ncbi:hypothetical protein OTBS_0012 [Orientia tsutsugamushi str. Boryong]|uniref:Uncharacterized protein n=1 Tax=Orientia tsutsugamushi (strain Boryong) TaxID=357244 RepID=A5CBX1_ORITB|nr:hypothetical protein OTBS_0012 [Orientia tsutsugamushi str. Boryong]
MIFFEDFNASAKDLLSSSLKLRRSHTIDISFSYSSPFNDIALLHYLLLITISLLTNPL